MEVVAPGSLRGVSGTARRPARHRLVADHPQASEDLSPQSIGAREQRTNPVVKAVPYGMVWVVRDMKEELFVRSPYFIPCRVVLQAFGILYQGSVPVIEMERDEMGTDLACLQTKDTFPAGAIDEAGERTRTAAEDHEKLLQALRLNACHPVGTMRGWSRREEGPVPT